MTTDWSARWLDLVESAPEFPEAALRRGADYAAFDWQLDLDIRPGRATTTASSGRLQYEAAITVPTLSSEQIDAVVASIASSTERLAAVLDGELPDDLDHVLDLDPAAIRSSCTCRSIDRPCKHAAAVPHLLADAIVEDPFDLLHLRGLPRTDLVARLTASRRADDDGSDSTSADPESAGTDPAAEPVLRFARAAGPLPADLPIPEQAGRLAPFPTPPPAGASFTEEGLRILADDAAGRALGLLSTGSHQWTELDPTTDLARRAAELEDGPEWRGLVARAQVTSQELRARAVAWRVGGPAAVSAHIAPVEIEPDPDDADIQWRRTADGTRVRFEKTKGRWLAQAVEPAGPTAASRPSADRPNEVRQ